MGQVDHVITFGPPKEAALYFEQVLPLDFSMAWFGALGIKDDTPGIIADAENLGIPFDGKNFDEKIVKSLLPRVDDPLTLYANQLAVTSALPISIFLNTILDKGGRDNLASKRKSSPLRSMFEMAGLDPDELITAICKGTLEEVDISSKIVPKIKWYVKKSGFLGAPSWVTISNVDDKDILLFTKKNKIGSAIALKNLGLVDVRKVSWEAIIEFRKDKRSLSSLRRFRMLFADNYEGKDEIYVRDKIGALLEDYETTAKVWGFDTVRKTLSVAVSNQNVATSSIATLAPAIAGMPLPIAAGAGAAITLGNCVLEFSRVFVDKRRESLSSPLSYLTMLKKLNKSASS